MTLSGQSDQKLGTLAVRVKFSISEFAWISIYCCCYDLGRGSVVVERVVWGSSENYLSERCFEILSGSHLRVAWYVKSLSKQNYCYPLFFPVSHKRFMAVWWLGDIWSYGSCWGRGRMKRYLHREMQCLTNISRLTTAHRTMKHSTWNTLLQLSVGNLLCCSPDSWRSAGLWRDTHSENLCPMNKYFWCQG